MAAEVVTFTADLGQGEELEPARKKAEMAGVKLSIFIDDLRGVRRGLRLPDDARQRAVREGCTCSAPRSRGR
jgi:hypothetical protein